jgi:hypothetical protein
VLSVLQLLAAGALPLRERLGVLLAALDILKGQGEALTIDRRAFYNQLYQALLLVPLQLLHETGDIPAKLASKLAGHLAGNGAAAANGAVDEDEQWADREDLQALQAVRASLLGLEVAAAEQQQQQQQQQQKGAAGSVGTSSSRDVAPTPVLLLRCLEQQLLGVKQTDMGRLAAFAKRLAQLMLSSSTPEALGCGCLLYRLMRRYPKLACLFEWEGGAPVGGRQFDADCADPSEAGALVAPLALLLVWRWSVCAAGSRWSGCAAVCDAVLWWWGGGMHSGSSHAELDSGVRHGCSMSEFLLFCCCAWFAHVCCVQLAWACACLNISAAISCMHVLSLLPT